MTSGSLDMSKVLQAVDKIFFEEFPKIFKTVYHQA
jgi:hypothetical protein